MHRHIGLADDQDVGCTAHVKPFFGKKSPRNTYKVVILHCIHSSRLALYPAVVLHCIQQSALESKHIRPY
jgi:hypothetical protein